MHSPVCLDAPFKPLWACSVLELCGVVPGSHINHFLVEFSQWMILGGLEGRKIREASMCLPLVGVIIAAVLVTKSYPTPCDPMDCSLPGSSVHGISQARILEWLGILDGLRIVEWAAISFSRRSSWPRDWVHLLHGKGDSLPLDHLGGPCKGYALTWFCVRLDRLLTLPSSVWRF